MKTRVPCCSICQTRYNEEERVPLMLQCGHGFCKECLSRIFSTSPDTTLSCPRCRHVSTVGNSVQALPKNYAVVGLLRRPSSKAVRSVFDFDFDYTEDEDEDEEEEEDDDDVDVDVERLRRRWRRSHGAQTSWSGRIGDLRLVKRIGEGRRAEVEMWTAVMGGRHKVVVKKVAVVGEVVEWMMEKLELLRRGSMWCRNVCTFHGAVKLDNCLCIVMDRCYGSLQSEMHRNEGRLTLEQVLRFCFVLFFDLCYFTIKNVIKKLLIIRQR